MVLPFTFTIVPHREHGLMVPLAEVVEYLRCAAAVAEQAPVIPAVRPPRPRGLDLLDREEIALVTHHHTRAATLRVAAGEIEGIAAKTAAMAEAASPDSRTTNPSALLNGMAREVRPPRDVLTDDLEQGNRVAQMLDRESLVLWSDRHLGTHDLGTDTHGTYLAELLPHQRGAA